MIPKKQSHPPNPNPIKTLSSQLRKKGLMMIAEPLLDPTLGTAAMYTFRSLKPGMSNTDVAYKLYYAGEVAKWSPSRRKAIDKLKRAKAATAEFEARLEKQAEAERRIKEESETETETETESGTASVTSSEKESVTESGSGSRSE